MFIKVFVRQEGRFPVQDVLDVRQTRARQISADVFFYQDVSENWQIFAAIFLALGPLDFEPGKQIIKHVVKLV